MIDNLFWELSELEQVEAISLGGSRSGENYDEKSDYDVYVYVTEPLSEQVRKSIEKAYLKNIADIWKSEITTGNMRTTVY